MDRPRILFDFNRYGVQPTPLTHADTIVYSDGTQVTLSDGMPVFLYEPDTDWYERVDNLLADGVAIWCADGLEHGPMCCVRLDERGIRHESDGPDFVLPTLAPARMREAMYRNIEQAVSRVPEPDRYSVKYSVTTWIGELRKIDAGERI
jgi:hypothetical protein